MQDVASNRSAIPVPRVGGWWLVAAGVLALLAASCASDPTEGAAASGPATAAVSTTTTSTASTSTTSTATTSPAELAEESVDTTVAEQATVKPDWLGSRPLPTLAGGAVVPQTTPDELIDRRFPTDDTIPPPPGSEFSSTIEPLSGEPLARSTWNEECPVGVEDLAYLTVSFWGFDERAHQGELIVHTSVAEDMVRVFRTLYEARFPIEEMRIVTPADLDADPTGDGNNTAAFVCRAVTGGSRFSEHAFGLAIDINPFHNPYERGDLVLPELAGYYVDRSQARFGMISEGDVVVGAFDAIGWGWGGRWSSLKDYQHFAQNDR